MSVQLIGQREYARRRGVAPSAVARAVAEQRISLIDGKIDPVVADIQWESNTRARADSGKRTTPRGDDGAAPAQPETAPGQALPAASAGLKHDPQYFADRARRERADADLAELELLQRKGELYSRAEVDSLLERVLGRLRPALLQISSRLAAILAAEADPLVVQSTLDAEVRAVLASAVGEG